MKTTSTDVDNAGNSASPSSAATVADAALSSSGTTVNATNPVAAVVATFGDADPNGTASDYTATIDWGDGSAASAGTVAASGGGFSVSGSHSYATLGPYTVTTHVCDVGGKCTDATGHVLVFAYASGGSFVVGDETVGPVSGAVGKAVFFWGSRWSSMNSLSGGVAPSTFKGFEGNATRPACGVSWTAPRNATPPATVPSYTAVIVSSTIAVSSKSFSGNNVHVVIVKTDPGYRPKPSTPGTGTIVAVFC